MEHPLREYRRTKKITLEDAALALDVSAANLSRIETGKHAPSADLMSRIAAWSGGAVTPNNLLGISAGEAA